MTCSQTENLQSVWDLFNFIQSSLSRRLIKKGEEVCVI
jgi:hypothetical protein